MVGGRRGRYLEAGRRGREGCWRTTYIPVRRGWQEKDGGLLEDINNEQLNIYRYI